MEVSTAVSEGRQKIHEYGFKEVRGTSENLALDRTDLPWLPANDENGDPQIGIMVPLALVETHEGEQFYCGSAVKGKTLIEQAAKVGPKSDVANKLFYAAVQKQLSGGYTKTLDDAVTSTFEGERREIFYASNGRGAIRTYYMQMPEKEGKPVFLRVAVSSGKGSEIKVLSVLTNQDKLKLKKTVLGH